MLADSSSGTESVLVRKMWQKSGEAWGQEQKAGWPPGICTQEVRLTCEVSKLTPGLFP